MRWVIPILLLLLSTPASLADSRWQVCFTPGGLCTELIVKEIEGAQHSIRVQAYSFTSVPILSALKAAHSRGIDVQVIVDKTSARVSKSGSRYSAATYLSNAGIPVWVDARVSIAHSEVMIIDGATVRPAPRSTMSPVPANGLSVSLRRAAKLHI
jgi:phospholipase D